MIRLATAIMFLTRVPIGGKWNIGAEEVSRSVVFFPLVGAAIGGCQWLLLQAILALSHLAGKYRGAPLTVPAPVAAIFVIALGAYITGALHLDGVADMADGFGGGHSREDVLRIMRDHSIGAFGAVALILVLGLKFAGISFLIGQPKGTLYIIAAPAIARWTIVILGFFLPYARLAEGGLGAAATRVRGVEVFVSTLITALIAALLLRWMSIFCIGMSVIASAVNGWMSMRRIQGITGDTLGANTEICEALMLATGCFLNGA